MNKQIGSSDDESGEEEGHADAETARTAPEPTAGDPWAEVKRVQAELAGRKFSDSSELIREDRDR